MLSKFQNKPLKTLKQRARARRWIHFVNVRKVILYNYLVKRLNKENDLRFDKLILYMYLHKFYSLTPKDNLCTLQLVEICSVVLKKIFKCRNWMYFRYYRPLKKGVILHLYFSEWCLM